MEEEDDVIQEMPEYSPKSDFSKAELVEQAVFKVVENRGQEMKEGYFNNLIDKSGMLKKVWVADSRDKFFGSVEVLKALLSPEGQRDKDYQKDDITIYEDYKTIKMIYEYEEKLLSLNETGGLVYKKTGRKIIPSVDAEVIIERFDPRQKKLIGEPVKGGWNDKLNIYKDELVELYDRWFAALNDLIDRLNYFKVAPSF